MDSYNLKTASTYVNNLLLARGLLRNGKPIEFARPSKGDGGIDATMAQIINLVHDLILRRDREQEQRESLAQTIRTFRTEATRNTLSLERLQSRNDDLSRQLSLAQSQERSARTAARSAEASARSLREEMARLKTTVHQVRTSCANDIRKRDLQIQRLKTHLTYQQRGNKTGIVGASITIIPAVTSAGRANGKRDGEDPETDDPEYSLKQETTEFLTQLSQSLSDENDNLIGLVRSTLSTLKELQGLPESAQRNGAVPGSGHDMEEINANMLRALPTSYDALAADMDCVLETLRTLLTNPNFVPIDEVAAREEEIARLREGWVKMETRLKQVISLTESWRKRMLYSGDTVTVNLEELSKLGESFENIQLGETRAERAKGREEAAEEIDLVAQSDGESSSPEEPRLAVEEKLKVAQEEAEAATNLKLKSPRIQIDTSKDGKGESPRRSPRKTRIGGRPRRRKSTLSPEELEQLLGFG